MTTEVEIRARDAFVTKSLNRFVTAVTNDARVNLTGDVRLLNDSVCIKIDIELVDVARHLGQGNDKLFVGANGDL